MLDHGDAPAGYPEINNATRSLRAAAAGKGDTERMSLWAGQGYRSALDRPAGEIIAWLCGEDSGTDPAGIGGSQP
jgi:nitronate monooxygenase